jgi:hypothetical protein
MITPLDNYATRKQTGSLRRSVRDSAPKALRREGTTYQFPEEMPHGADMLEPMRSKSKPDWLQLVAQLVPADSFSAIFSADDVETLQRVEALPSVIRHS